MALRVSRLGRGTIEKIRIFCIIFLRLLHFRLGIKSKPAIFHLFVNSRACDIYVSERLDDIWVLDEVFAQKEYEVGEVENPFIIVDAGGNIGLSAIYFATKFPEAQIYTIEANPEIFNQLLKNVSAFSNIIPIHSALVPSDTKEVTFFINKRSLSSSTIPRTPEDREVSVPCISLSKLMQQYELPKIDIFKFDIEGGEENIFKIDDLDKKVMFCIGEVHTDLMGIPREEFLKDFKGYATHTSPTGKGRFILRATSEFSKI